MKILVTGATGFIGRAFVAAVKDAHEVIALGRSGTGIDSVQDIIFDLAQDDCADELPDKIDAIVHLAQSPRYGEFPEGALDVFNVNVASTARLLDYARKVGAEWFFLASTGSVYEPYKKPLIEDRPVAPYNYYPVSKLAAEKMVLAYRNYFRVCIFRLFFPYGPGQTDHLIPRLVNRISADKAVMVDGTEGGLKLSLLYISDLIELMQAALRQQWEGIVNAASPHPVNICDLAYLIGERLKKEPKFKHTDRYAVTLLPELHRLQGLYPNMQFTVPSEGLSFLNDQHDTVSAHLKGSI